MWSDVILPVLGMAFLIVVAAAAVIAVRRLGGRANRGTEPLPTELDVARLTQALDAMQERLGELEERVDFAERLLAKDRVAERLDPPHR